MTDPRYQEHVDLLRTLASLDATFEVEEQRLLAARQTALRAASSHAGEALARVATLRDDARRTDARLTDLGRRYGVATTVGGAAVPPTIDHHAAALRELTEELRRLEEADAWLRRTAEQIATAAPLQPAYAQPAAPAAAPAPVPQPPLTKAPPGRPGRWPFVVVPAALVAIIVLVLVVIQKG